MGKAKTVSQTEKEDSVKPTPRRSLRTCVISTAPKPTRAAESKRKPAAAAAAAKKVSKPKKAKQAENGNPKTEEPKAEATEAK